MDIKVIISIVSFVIGVLISFLIYKGKKQTVKIWVAEVLVCVAISAVLRTAFIMLYNFFFQ